MKNLPKLALSIRQPWAYGIMSLGKDIENRSWSTKVRGKICVHASAGMTKGEYEDFLSTAHMVSTARPFPPRTILPPFSELERGGIVGTVEIVDCVDQSDSPWFFGTYGFVLVNPQPIPFIALKGSLGFFSWRERAWL